MPLKFSLILLLTTFSSLCWPQWNATQLEQMRAIDQKYLSIDHTGLATFWGGFKRSMGINFNNGDTIAWKTPLFKQGHLPIYFSENASKAPLVVFMPGIFGATLRGLTPPTIERLEQMGVHVLVVPNLVSDQYVHAYPLYRGNIVENEAQVLESALEFALAKLPGKVTKVHVIAESLGTVVAAGWTAWDSSHKKRINSLTLMSPPLDLSSAMTNFDNIINEYRPDLNKCSRASMYWRVLTEFILREIPRDFPIQEKRCIAAVVLVEAFLKSAQSAYLAHTVTLDDKSAYTVRSFEDFFRRYRPELWSMLERKDAGLKLATWIKIIRQNSQMPVRILTSKDDFLNRGLTWNDFLNDTQLSNDHLFIFSWGGHSGMIATPELDKVLKEVIDSI